MATVSWIGPSASDAQELEPPKKVESTIEWITDLPGALASAKSSRKPVCIAFFAAWCTSCRRFRSGTLPAREVQDLADRFIWVMVDIDRELSLARLRGVLGTPRFDLLDADGVTRVRISGVLSPVDFRHNLEAFLGGLPNPPGPSYSTVRGDDHTPLTWSPDGYRGLSICFSNVGYGPLNLPSQSPFQSLRSTLQPRTPSTLAEGHMEVRVTETWSNLWAFESGDYLIDYEMLRSSLSISYGISDTLEFNLEIVDKSRFGGGMDGLIQGFHDAFGISQGDRDQFPEGSFRFEMQPTGGSPGVSLTRADRGSFSQELLWTLQHNVTCGSEDMPALAYSLTARTDRDPAGDLSGGSPVDLALSISAAKRVGDVYGYLGFGFAWFGKEEFRGISLEATQSSLLCAVEWRYGPATSFLLQYLGSQNVFDGPGPFSKPSHELTLGWKGEVARGVVLEIGLVENFVLMDNSPDLGFHAGLTYRF